MGLLHTTDNTLRILLTHCRSSISVGPEVYAGISNMSKNFVTLKQCLLQSPNSFLPDFSPTAKPFVLQTDESAIEIGAVLEQGSQVVA